MIKILRFDITDESYEALTLACQIAFSNNADATFSHWRLLKIPANEDWHSPVNGAVVERITFFSQSIEGSHPFPTPLLSTAAPGILWSFLQNTTYGPEPDHDGFNRKGWRLFDGGAEERGAVLALEPRWMLYGK